MKTSSLFSRPACDIYRVGPKQFASMDISEFTNKKTNGSLTTNAASEEALNDIYVNKLSACR